MKCTKCTLTNNKEGINYYKGKGNPNAQFMFVGDCINWFDYKMSGRPLGGKFKSGLSNLLDQHNIHIDDVYRTNACRCFEKDKKLKSGDLDKCFLYLNREINNVNPKLIIALGPAAMYSLTGIPQAEHNFYVGKVIESTKLKRLVYITYHHLDIKSNKLQSQMQNHMKVLPKMIKALPFETKYYDYTLVDTQDKFDVMFPLLIKQILHMDMECDGLDAYDPNLNIRTLQLGINEDNIYILIPKIIYANINKLQQLFNECPIIGQDFKFDAKWLYVKLGIVIKKWYFDTCLAEYIISGMKNNTLNFLTGKYNPDYYGYWKDIPKGGAQLVTDKLLLYKYGASDVGTMMPISKGQQKILFKNRQNWLFENITMPCNKILTNMSLRGVEIDLKELWRLDKVYKDKAQKTLDQAKVLPGIHECEVHFNKKFNPNSNDMVRWLLIEYYELPVLKRTDPSKTFPEGQPKVSQDEMKIYAGHKYGNPYCKLMEKYGSLQTIRRNFLSGSVDKLKGDVAHTNYSLHATTTGRPNSKEPNLLNYPSSKDHKQVKKILKARDGHIFIAADMSQVEVRVAAVIYDDQKLIDLCNEEGRDDFHSVITAKVHGLHYDDVYYPYKDGDVEMTDKRRICKSITFGILYQMGEDALAYQMGVPKKKAKTFIREYFEMFPDLERNIEKIKEFVIQHGYVSTYFNFRRFFEHHRPKDHATLREAVNSPIQGTAWNLMQLSLIEIDKRLKGMKSKLNLQVYDSAYVETWKSEVPQVAQIMKESMEGCNLPFEGLNRVKIKIDMEIGPNVCDMKSYKIGG